MKKEEQSRRKAAVAGLLALTATAGLCVGGRADAQTPTSFRVEGGSVVARDAGAELWRINHRPDSVLVPAEGDLRLEGGRCFYANECYLMEIDAAAGAVVRRMAFPGRITGVTRRGVGVSVDFDLALGDGTKTSNISYVPGEALPPLWPTGEEQLAAPQMDAQDLVVPFVLDGFRGRYTREVAEAALRSSIHDEAFRRNPTNPWFMFYKGVILEHVRRPEEARRAFRAAIGVDGAPPYEHLRMSSLMAMMGFSAESDIAFECGYAAFVRAGFEPEQLMSARMLRLYYAAEVPYQPDAPVPAGPDLAAPPGAGQAGADRVASHAAAVRSSVQVSDTDRVIELTDRIRRLAPRCEGAAYAFAGLAERLGREGRSAEAIVWSGRARLAAQYTEPVGSLETLYAGLACLAALAVMLGISFTRAFGHQRRDLAPLGGWMASWRQPSSHFTRMAFAYATRMELFGILLLAAAGFAASFLVIRNEATVLRTLSLPAEFKAGSWGRRVVGIEDQFNRYKTPAGSLVYAIARQQEGETGNAEEVYNSLASAGPAVASVAWNNLGVILASAGRSDKAKNAFQKALERDPGLAEARYNLGMPVDSPRVSRARKYRPGEPLVALPDADVLAAALANGPSLPAESEDEGAAGSRGLFVALTWATLIVSLMTGLLVLPFFAIRRKTPPRGDRSALAGLAYVVPGTGAGLAPFGGLVLAGWLFSLATLLLLLTGVGAARPAGLDVFEQTFGLASRVVFPFEHVLALAGPVAFVGLWVLNGVFLARSKATRDRAVRKGPKTEMAPAVKAAVPDGRQAPDHSHAHPPEAAVSAARAALARRQKPDDAREPAPAAVPDLSGAAQAGDRQAPKVEPVPAASPGPSPAPDAVPQGVAAAEAARSVETAAQPGVGQADHATVEAAAAGEAPPAGGPDTEIPGGGIPEGESGDRKDDECPSDSGQEPGTTSQ